MFGFVVFIVFSGLIILGVVFGYKQKMQTLDNWERAANLLGIHFINGGLIGESRIHGTINSHSVTVTTETRGSGKNQYTVTVYHIKYSSPIHFKFDLTKQHLLHSFGKIFGMQDIEIGDKTFDDSVVVKSSDAAKIRDFLTAPRRKHIKMALKSFKNITISNNGVKVETRGMEKSQKKLTNTVKTLCAMAEAIRPSREKKHPIEKAKKARENGDLHKAMEIITGAEGLSEDETLEINEMKGELHYIGNDSKKAEEIFDILSKNMKDDDHSKQWKQLAENNSKISDSEQFAPPPLPSKEEQTSSQHVQDTVVTTIKEKAPDSTSLSISAINDANKDDQSPAETKNVSDDESLSVAQFCKNIFSDDMGAFDSTRLFDSDYKGKRVKWSGKLISASQFSFDFVFKDSPGVKATYEIFEIKSTYSTTKVKAIVRYTEEHLDELKEKIGKENIEFSGNLISLDGLTKNIFIS